MRYNCAGSIAVSLSIAIFAGLPCASAQYKQTNLVSNVTGGAKHFDPLIRNAWGISHQPGGPFWISNPGSGTSTIYNGAGVTQLAAITIPSASGTGTGTPTGMVANTSGDFEIGGVPASFIFATLDGTISGWTGAESASIVVNNSGSNAVYTGLAATSKGSGNFLYAADIANNRVDMFDGSFNFVKSFSDSSVPAGFNVFGIQVIGPKVYVTYTSKSGGTGGYIDIFSESGTFQKRFAHGKPLNQPWGVALAPKNFGPLSGTILVTNKVDAGTINGFNVKTGKFVGTVKTDKGKAIKIQRLWGIEFGDGGSETGKTNELFFTAGPDAEVNGLFGVIQLESGVSVNSTPQPGATPTPRPEPTVQPTPTPNNGIYW